MLRGMLVVGAFVGLVALGLNALFTVVGLRFGWWVVGGAGVRAGVGLAVGVGGV